MFRCLIGLVLLYGASALTTFDLKCEGDDKVVTGFRSSKKLFKPPVAYCGKAVNADNKAICAGKYKKAEVEKLKGILPFVDCGEDYFLKNATLTVNGHDVVGSVVCCEMKKSSERAIEQGQEDVDCGDEGWVIQQMAFDYFEDEDEDEDGFNVNLTCVKLSE